MKKSKILFFNSIDEMTNLNGKNIPGIVYILFFEDIELFNYRVGRICYDKIYGKFPDYSNAELFAQALSQKIMDRQFRPMAD